MVNQNYEMELHTTEQWSKEKGKSYWIKVWGEYLPLDIEIQEEQIIRVLEEIPDARYEKPGFWRRDFFTVVRLTPQQWADVTDYIETGGVYDDDYLDDEFDYPDTKDS